MGDDMSSSYGTHIGIMIDENSITSSFNLSDYCGCVVCCETITSHAVECTSIMVRPLYRTTDQAEIVSWYDMLWRGKCEYLSFV